MSAGKSFEAIHKSISSTPTKGPTKQLPTEITIHGFASFREKILVVAESGEEEMVLRITPKMECYVEINDSMQAALCLKDNKAVIRAVDENEATKYRTFKSMAHLPNLARGWRMIELCGMKRYVLVFTEKEFERFVLLPSKQFISVGGNIQNEKISTLAAHAKFKQFFALQSASSIHGSNKPAGARNIHIDSIELFPSTVSLPSCHIHVTRDSFCINLSHKITVQFANVKSINFEPGKDKGTPVIVALHTALVSPLVAGGGKVTEIGFVLTNENLNNAQQLKARFVDVPRVPYNRNCEFNFSTKRFERGGAPVVVVENEDNLELPLPSNKQTFAKPLHANPNPVAAAPRRLTYSFALTSDGTAAKKLEGPTTTKPPPSMFPSDVLKPEMTTTALKRVHGLARPTASRADAAPRTYAAAATPKKRARGGQEEEEFDFIATPFTPRTSARLSGKSPSNAQDAKILFFYPSSSNEPAAVALRDLGFDTITMRAMDRSCLRPGEYLNDSVMDFYGKFCFRERILKSSSPSTTSVIKNEIHLMSSFLFSRMDHKITKLRKRFSFTAEDGAEQRFAVYSRVRYWSRGVDLFKKRFLILPINKSLHWSVAIVRLDGNIEDASKPPQVTVYTLDSLGNFHNSNHVANVLLLYLEHEWRSRALTLEQGKEWPMPARNVTISASPPLEEEEDSDDCQIVEAPNSITPPPQEEDAFVVERVALSANKRVVQLKVPRQQDAHNCGVFALRNIEVFLEAYEDKIRTSIAKKEEEEDLFEDNNALHQQDGGDAVVEFFKGVRFSDANQFRRNLTELMDKLTKEQGVK